MPRFEGFHAKPKHFSQEEVTELVRFAKQSQGIEPRENITHPTITVQWELTHAIKHYNLERAIRLGEKYLEIFKGGDVQEVAREVYSIMNEEGEAQSHAGGAQWCETCEGYYLPHEH